MILGFKQKFPQGENSFFKEKILAGCQYSQGKNIEIAKAALSYVPKIHTIREDRHNRWTPGKKIQMCYRGKNYRILDEFNKNIPELQTCICVQTIDIKRLTDTQRAIIIDGRQLGLVEHLLLAKNDGFDDVYQFYKWFNKDFKGKIIHWTEFRY